MSDFAIGEQNFREKPDISQVFIRAIDRANHVAVHGGFGVSEEGINQILAMLPLSSREWVYNQKDKCMKDTVTLVYKKYCGVRLGEFEPLRHNTRIPFTYIENEVENETGEITFIVTDEIDLDDPNIISPKIKTIPVFDKQLFNEVVMEAAEYAGLTWQSELLLLDGGDTVEEIERKNTPYRMPDHIREETQYRIDDDGRKYMPKRYIT